MTVVDGSLILAQVDAASLAGPLAGYLVTFAEAGGAKVPDPIALPVDAASFSVPLDAGTWTATVVAVDAAGNPLMAPVVSAPLVLAGPTLVNVPMAIALTAA